MTTYTSRSLADTQGIAASILKDYPGLHVVALTGALGAGKTTLVQAIGAALGISRLVSPTFSLIKEYDPQSGAFRRLYHIDLYRLSSLKEALDLGLEEILSEPRSLILIEWPEKIIPLLPPGTLHVDIKLINPEERQITLTR